MRSTAHWTRRAMLALLITATSACAQAPAPRAAATPIAAQRLNVLLILVADLKPPLGPYADRTPFTQNMHRLDQRGVRLDLAYATHPVCAPTRNHLPLAATLQRN